MLDMMVEGVRLYKITADYCNRPHHPTYYCLAHNKREATKRFSKKFDWLKVLDCEPVEDDELAQEVLDHPEKYIVL